MQLVLQNTTVYEVEYEYAQKRYIVELPYDPGQTIPLRISPAVSPMASAPPMPAPVGISTVPPVMTTQPTVLAPAPAPVYIAPYPSYGYPYGYYPPVGVNFGFGYYRHYRR